MKKLILSLALLATMAVSQAQDQTKKKSFGIKSGLNYSTATVKREFENSVSPRTPRSAKSPDFEE